MAADSKDRMIRSAYQLFRERGYSGTGFREISAHSGVAKGAVYHHFPAGKADLAEQVIRLAGREVGDLMAAAADGVDPGTLVEGFAAGWAEHVRTHDFAAGCAIAAIVSESQHDAPQLARTAADEFGRWRAILAESLAHHGVPSEHAASLATLAVAAVEGAVILARAERATQPLDDIGRELRKSFEAAVHGARSAQSK